jgi:hypothetical protein
MNFPEFHKALRILVTLDMQDLVDAHAIDQSDAVAWNAFKADRLKWILHADQRRSEALWLAMRRCARASPLAAYESDDRMHGADDNIIQFLPRTRRSQ